MSTQPARGVKSEAINDDTVAQYLQTYPDFFERNSALLARLRLPHVRNSGQTVSLVERQVDVLRERNLGLERKLNELIDVARTNEALTDKIHRFDRRLIRARTMAETITAIEVSWGQETWDDHFKFLSRDSVPTCRDECSCYHFAKSKWG